MKKQRQARRKIIRQWTALPSDKRQSVEQIAAFAKMAVQPDHFASFWLQSRAASAMADMSGAKSTDGVSL